MSSSLERVGAILSLVDEISSETNLLALNASIEAAHAGNAGLGFSVIAGEIRKLADHTHVATNEVGGVIETISRAGEGMRVGMLASAERTEEVEGRARQVESVVDRLLTTIASTVDRTQDLAALANQHMTEFDGLLRELDTTAAAIDVSTAAATDSRGLTSQLVRLRRLRTIDSTTCTQAFGCCSVPISDNRPPRTPYAEFQRDGCVLTRGGNQRPWAIYTYARDTGIVYNDLSLALFATDRRVGTIRIIYDADVV